MGIFKSFIEKFTKGIYYVVDAQTFRTYLEKEVQFCISEDLVFCTELNIFLSGEKHFMRMFNNLADEENPRDGVTVVYDGTEYTSIDSFFENALRYVPTYFKIELTLGDDVWLNEYKASHPELNPEDY